MIYKDNKVAGRLRIESGVESIHIGGIQILPQFQSQGIGKIIIDMLKNESKEITWLVHKINNRAIRFYQREGFVIDSQTESQFKMIFISRSNIN